MSLKYSLQCMYGKNYGTAFQLQSCVWQVGSTVQCEQLSPRQLGIRALLHLRGIHGDQRGGKQPGLYLPIRYL